MLIRIASVDLLTFLLCYKYNLWGANNIYISKWNIGDQLIFKIEDKLIAISEITGEAYMDDKIIWDNGLFWNRIPLKFLKVLEPSESISFSATLKPLFLKKWGKKYGWVILNKYPLPENINSIIKETFDEKHNASFYYENIDKLIKKVKRMEEF